MADAAAVVDIARTYLQNPTDGAIDTAVDRVREYYRLSEVEGADAILTLETADSDGGDFPGPSQDLLYSACSDLLVFACIGVVDARAAEEQVLEPAEDLEVTVGYLEQELGTLADSFEAMGIPLTRGGQLPRDLSRDIDRFVYDVANDSTSSCLECLFGSLEQIVPTGKARKSLKELSLVGRIPHLGGLLRWAQRVLNLALDKLRRIFGPRFDDIEHTVSALIDGIVSVRERVAERLFDVPGLLRECHDRIDSLQDGQFDICLTKFDTLEKRYRSWDAGLDFGGACLRWGQRITNVAPPVAIALASLRQVLSLAAVLTGQYHLDWPEIRYLPWQTNGVLSLLPKL